MAGVTWPVVKHPSFALFGVKTLLHNKTRCIIFVFDRPALRRDRLFNSKATLCSDRKTGFCGAIKNDQYDDYGTKGVFGSGIVLWD
jgi:hypothetical protein